MILYLDTSALVSLFVRESGSLRTRAAAGRSTRVATSFLAYPEMLAALARRLRIGEIPEAASERAQRAFDSAWPSWIHVRLDRRLLPEIRRILKVHPLAGADAVHLASALLLARHFAGSEIPLVFACSDRTLETAARADGLACDF